MKNKQTFFLLGIILLVVQTLFSACTVVGALAGKSIKEKYQEGTFKQDELDQINKGNKVKVYTTNKKEEMGKFKGIVQQTHEIYHKNYNKFKFTNPEFNLPNLSDTIKVRNNRMTTNRMITTKFWGFDRNKFYIQGIGIESFANVPFETDPVVSFNTGKKVDFKLIEGMMKQNTVPYLSAVDIKVSSKQRIMIPVNEVLKVEMACNKKRHLVLKGALIGFCVDLSIFIFALYDAGLIKFD